MFSWLLQSSGVVSDSVTGSDRPDFEVSDFDAFGAWFAENGLEFILTLGIGIFIGIIISIIFAKLTGDKEE